MIASSVQSGGYAITWERLNHNIYSIGSIAFLNRGDTLYMQTILWDRFESQDIFSPLSKIAFAIP